MSAAAPNHTRPLRSILRNGNNPRTALRISIPSAQNSAATTTADASTRAVDAQNQTPIDDTPTEYDFYTPLPSPPLPPPPPPNTPTRLRFAAQPRHRPSRKREQQALQALPYNGALRPKARKISEDAHNALSIIDHAERAQVRRKHRSSGTDLERAALEALQTWGPEVWHREGWDANFVEYDDSTRRGRRLRRPEGV
ncbi:hypothetical protein L226DRAFT_531171, partial [Lentinus tigrinus ALCF2SS1-7]